MNITDRAIQITAAAVVTPMLALGLYSGIAAAGLAPVAPWSPIGQHEQRIEDAHQERLDDLRDRTSSVPSADSDRNV